MKLILVFTLLWSKTLLASPNLSEKDLDGLEVLSFSLFILLFLIFVYILPIWLTYRVRKLSIEKKLTRNKLFLHVMPAIILGCWGLSDLLNPDYFDEATIKNYFGMLINIVFIYLGVTTYQKYSFK